MGLWDAAKALVHDELGLRLKGTTSGSASLLRAITQADRGVQLEFNSRFNPEPLSGFLPPLAEQHVTLTLTLTLNPIIRAQGHTEKTKT